MNNDVKKEPEKLIYTQTYTDIIILIVIVLVMFFVIYLQLKEPYARNIVLESFAFIIFLIIVVYVFFAIRRFEVYPEKIIVKFSFYPIKTIMKHDIKKIKIKLESGFILGNRSKEPKMVFKFYLNKPLNIFWYSKKFSINNFFYGGTYYNDETKQLVSFFRKHYSDILEDLSGLPSNLNM